MCDGYTPPCCWRRSIPTGIGADLDTLVNLIRLAGPGRRRLPAGAVKLLDSSLYDIIDEHTRTLRP